MVIVCPRSKESLWLDRTVEGSSHHYLNRLLEIRGNHAYFFGVFRCSGFDESAWSKLVLCFCGSHLCLLGVGKEVKVVGHTLTLTLIHTLIWLVFFNPPNDPTKFFECVGVLLAGSFLGVLLISSPPKRKPKPLRWDFQKPKTCKGKKCSTSTTKA